MRKFSPAALRKLRADAKLSLEDLGIRARMHKQQISRYEQGHAVPTLTVVLRLAAALDAGVEQLLC